jgi:DNA excision repair protein ERCC-3
MQQRREVSETYGGIQMNYDASRPLMVQNDLTVLVETAHPEYPQVRDTLSRFSDLLKNPGWVHTYRITPLSLWNAAASGMGTEDIIPFLREHCKYPLPAEITRSIEQYMRRYGLFQLKSEEGRLYLESGDSDALRQIAASPAIKPYLRRQLHPRAWEIFPHCRGIIKQEMMRLGFPVEDVAGYAAGERLAFRLKDRLPDGSVFQLRDYQRMAVDAFYREGSSRGGSGLIVLPCGAGKTVIGIAAMARLNCATLILTTNVTSVRQWKRELLEKTTIAEEQIGEYTGARKEVRPITIATYQILTYRGSRSDELIHMKLFQERNWGLIIYDEVHLLPAPVFRVTAEIQATRRLGLTGTLVREDGHEEDVFSLVGPKRYDLPWKKLEEQGWIARVDCCEITVPLPDALQYAQAKGKMKQRIAGENPLKLAVVEQLLARHRDLPVLVIGQYLDQLRAISQAIEAPMISGQTPHAIRETLFEKFRRGEIKRLVVSKVANFAVDLPDAAAAIQVSGSFGSRQEEAQRLGRILRPKKGENKAYFYSIVTRDTKEQEFARNRQLFLLEQGYRYRLKEAEFMQHEGERHR